VRRGEHDPDEVVAVFNFTPVARQGYRMGVPAPGRYRELVNTDAEIYGGSNVGNAGLLETEAVGAQGLPQSLVLTLPPLAGLILKRD
jgi:1,4-alpha-glucan branching enzyme